MHINLQVLTGSGGMIVLWLNRVFSKPVSQFFLLSPPLLNYTGYKLQFFSDNVFTLLFICSIKKGEGQRGKKNVTLKLQGVRKADTTSK
jgi:hypothetical protein